MAFKTHYYNSLSVSFSHFAWLNILLVNLFCSLSRLQHKTLCFVARITNILFCSKIRRASQRRILDVLLAFDNFLDWIVARHSFPLEDKYDIDIKVACKVRQSIISSVNEYPFVSGQYFLLVVETSFFSSKCTIAISYSTE